MSDFVRPSSKRLKGHFWEEVGLLSSPAVGLGKADMNPTAMRDIYVFKKRISLCFGKVVGGKKKNNMQKESVGSP